jgi:hypothetical protein
MKAGWQISYGPIQTPTETSLPSHNGTFPRKPTPLTLEQGCGIPIRSPDRRKIPPCE